MDKNKDLEILKSLVISEFISDQKLLELSDRIEELCKLEINKVYTEIKPLPLVHEKTETFRNLSAIILSIIKDRNLNIRQFDKHCRSCIIPEAELIDMAEGIYEFYLQEMIQTRNETNGDYLKLDMFGELSYEVQKLYYEFIYMIPVVFKKAGYEIIRKSESEFINVSLAEQLARVFHASYKKAKQSGTESSLKIYEDLYLVNDREEADIPDYDDLREDFKLSNLDSAYHIPTKLLSIGYKLSYVDENEKEPTLLHLTDHEIETMARIEHDRWSWERRMNGWTYSKDRNNSKKKHNCLIPYDELPEIEKNKDRQSASLIPVLLKDIGYEAIHVQPELAAGIPYFKRDWGYISKITTEISLLKAQLQEDSSSALIHIDHIEVLLKSIKDAFTAGKRIQQSFLSTLLKFKEYLPDSFVLNKPKDIVSGDFYYIEKIDDMVVFAAADCTGHGIPAAILTSACYNFLDSAIRLNKITDPSEILNIVIPQLESMFKEEGRTVSTSGMDISICSLNTKTRKLSFSGFGNPLFYFKKGVFHQIKGVNSLANYDEVKDMLVKYEIQLHKGDTLYIFSDGFQDQHGGPERKRYTTGKFKEILHDIQELSIPEQCESLNQAIELWRRRDEFHYEQTDDILVVGLRI